MGDKTSIQISRELQEILSSQGKMGETYEDVIRRLVNGDRPDVLKMIRPVTAGICKGYGRVTKADMETLFGKQ